MFNIFQLGFKTKVKVFQASLPVPDPHPLCRQVWKMKRSAKKKLFSSLTAETVPQLREKVIKRQKDKTKKTIRQCNVFVVITHCGDFPRQKQTKRQQQKNDNKLKNKKATITHCRDCPQQIEIWSSGSSFEEPVCSFETFVAPHPVAGGILIWEFSLNLRILFNSVLIWEFESIQFWYGNSIQFRGGARLLLLWGAGVLLRDIWDSPPCLWGGF